MEIILLIAVALAILGLVPRDRQGVREGIMGTWTNRLTENDLLATLAGKESNGCDPTNVRACIFDERRQGREFKNQILSGIAEGSLDIYTARRLAKAEGRD